MDTLLTPQQAAEKLSIPVKSVHELCRRRLLGYVRVDDRGTRRFTVEQLERYVALRSVDPAQDPIDKRPQRRLPSPATITKGGDKEESSGVSARAQLRQEMRKWQ